MRIKTQWNKQRTFLFIPQSPGLGLEVDEKAMEKFKLNQ